MTTGVPLALEARGVSVRYGSATVLRDVDIDVRPGEVVALLGPNGAGKTTLMRALAGLAPGCAGRISVLGQDVSGLPSHKRVAAGLSLVPEGRGIFPHLTVRENLRLLGSVASGPDSVQRVLDAFPVLGERLNVNAGRMSGGQQQMLALARCLVTEPSVVLLDEVSMGLAPLVIDQIFDALGTLATSGVALVLVEQYVSRALAVADSVYVLTRGSVDWKGTPADISEEEIMRRYLSVGPAVDAASDGGSTAMP